jgi:hypothetical protein
MNGMPPDDEQSGDSSSHRQVVANVNAVTRPQDSSSIGASHRPEGLMQRPTNPINPMSANYYESSSSEAESDDSPPPFRPRPGVQVMAESVAVDLPPDEESDSSCPPPLGDRPVLGEPRFQVDSDKNSGNDSDSVRKLEEEGRQRVQRRLTNLWDE